MNTLKNSKTLAALAVLALYSLSGGVVQASEVTGTISNTGGGSGAIVVEAPSASPIAGSYVGTQSVELTATNSDSIHYTADGTTPSCSTGDVYSGAISVSSDQTIKAISCYPNSVVSDVKSYTYTITAAPASSGGGGGGTIPPPSNDADFNDDGKIDIFDLSILSSNWGSTTATSTTGDANGDGVVDIFDLNILSTNWTG